MIFNFIHEMYKILCVLKTTHSIEKRCLCCLYDVFGRYLNNAQTLAAIKSIYDGKFLIKISPVSELSL
jgi:hypothetical protein